jgi:hypothetical protein
MQLLFEVCWFQDVSCISSNITWWDRWFHWSDFLFEVSKFCEIIAKLVVLLTFCNFWRLDASVQVVCASRCLICEKCERSPAVKKLFIEDDSHLYHCPLCRKAIARNMLQIIQSEHSHMKAYGNVNGRFLCESDKQVHTLLWNIPLKTSTQTWILTRRLTTYDIPCRFTSKRMGSINFSVNFSKLIKI